MTILVRDQGTRASALLRVAGWVLGVLAVGTIMLVLGVASALLPVWFIVAALALPVFAIAAWARPEYGIVVVIAVVSELVHPAFLPRVPLLGGAVQAGDLALACMAAIVLAKEVTLQSKRVRDPVAMRMALLIGLLLVVVLFSALYSRLIKGVALKDILGESRHFAYFAVVPLTLATVKTRQQFDRFLVAICVVGALFSLGQVVQALTGAQIFGGSSARLEYLETLGDRSSGVFRSLTHGINLMILTMFLTLAAYALTRFNTLAAVLALGLVSAGVLATYGRTTWGTTVLGVLMLLYFVGRVGARRALILSCVGVAIAAALVGAVKPKIFVAVWERATSVSEELRRGMSINWRRYEADMVWPQVVKSPVIGIGIGNSYRPHASSDVVPEQVRYIHNSFLFILCKLGSLGAIAWILVFAQFLAVAHSTYKRGGLWDRVIVVSAVICAGRMVVSGITEPWLMIDAGIAFFSLCVALVLAVRRMPSNAESSLPIRSEAVRRSRDRQALVRLPAVSKS